MINRKYVAKPEGYNSKLKYNGIPKKTKLAVLKRDNYTCQVCGMSKDELKKYIPGMEQMILWTADHKVPRRFGGSDDLTNLQCMCPKCNNVKGDFYTNEETKEKIVLWKEIKHNLMKKYVIIGISSFMIGFIIAFIVTLILLIGGIV